MLTGRDGFRAQPVVPRARLEGTEKSSTPHSFSLCASVATTITALRAQDGFKSIYQVPNRRLPSSGLIQMFCFCYLFGRVFIDSNYTFAPSLKVGRLPRREEEAARSPVYPDHLFVFFQTQFQMLQEVVPNNWIGIPGNTSDPDTSKADSKKLLAPYDALVYREESQLMTNDQGKSWK